MEFKVRTYGATDPEELKALSDCVQDLILNAAPGVPPTWWVEIYHIRPDSAEAQETEDLLGEKFTWCSYDEEGFSMYFRPRTSDDPPDSRRYITSEEIGR